MPNGPEPPKLDPLVKINMWLGIALFVLVILLIAVLIAPYVRVGWAGDEDKIVATINELKTAIQSNPAGGLTAEQLKETLKPFNCQLQKAARENAASKNGDMDKLVKVISELASAMNSRPTDSAKAQRLDERLKTFELELKKLALEVAQLQADKATSGAKGDAAKKPRATDPTQ